MLEQRRAAPDQYRPPITGSTRAAAVLRNRAITRERTLGTAFELRLLALLVVCYAGFGKTFSYISVGPLYVGEVVLFLITCSLLVRSALQVSGMRAFALLAGSGIGGLQLITQLPDAVQPLEALRNFAVLYYAWFAVLAYSALRHHARGTRIPTVEQVRRLATATLLTLTIVTIIGLVLGNHLPVITGAGVRAFSYKPTDAGVVLLALLALWLRQVLPTWSVLLIIPQLFVAIAVSRSALLCTLAVLFIVVRRSPRALKFATAIAVVTLFLTIVDPSVTVNNRQISVRQIQANALSVIAPDAEAGADQTLSDNRDFRLLWWQAIIDDSKSMESVFAGQGWETNLADAYGFQTSLGSQSSLRNPHNVFVGLVGRAGWLVAGLYLTFILLFTWRVLRGLRFNNDFGEVVILEVVVIMALGALINGSTDVYLESPQNGIPFWILVGTGAAILANQRACPAPRRSSALR